MLLFVRPPAGGGGGGADPYGENVSLLLHMNGADGSTTFTDSSLNNYTVTRYGDAQISTAQAKYGGAAGYFDGSGGYLSANFPVDWTNDVYTIEAWIYAISLGEARAILGNHTGYANGFAVYTYSDGRLGMGRMNINEVTTSAGTISTNTWYHIAVVKEVSGAPNLGDNTKLFVNGNLTNFSGSAGSGTIWPNTPNEIRVGFFDPENGNTWHGYIDDLRITKGVARYTSNFTPPQAQLPDPSPLPTTGLQLWLKADAGVVDDDGLVSQWSDQSGNGNNATASGAARPSYVTNSLNGKPGLQFSGNQLLLTNNFYPVNYNTPITMIGVAKASASTVKEGQETARWFETASSQGEFDTGLVFGPYNGTPAFGSLVGISYQGENNILNSNMTEDEKSISALVNNGTISEYFHNGTSKGTYTFGWTSGGTTEGGFAIGATYAPNLNLTDFNSTSTIYELLLYNRALTTQERQQVESYLNAKYTIF